MKKTTVLICDDNIAVHESLTVYLNKSGIAVISAFDGNQMMKLLQEHSVDLIILDIMLPGKSGMELRQELRQYSDLPILMLSAKDEEDDRVDGLLTGADDYVTKPFSPREVAARVNSILKRVNPDFNDKMLSFSDLRLYPSSYKAFVRREPLELTPKEFLVLECLIKSKGKVLSRNRILDEVWGNNYFGDMRAVDTIIKRLRLKLDESASEVQIRSVYGIGYRIEDALGVMEKNEE